MTDRPRLVILGGPNGAGKTTLANELMTTWGLAYLGADRVAEQLGLGSTGAEAIHAGRVFLAQMEEAVAAQQSILLESTLSGLATRRWIDRFKRGGYDVTTVLVFTDSPELCIDRIRGRVARGGHFVPDEDVRRRFYRSVRNFWNSYRIQSDDWQLHYTGVDRSVVAARGEGASIVVLDERAFRLFERLLGGP